MSEELRARVVAGAALLDESVPGWESKIDTSTLRLQSHTNCVLGQIFGDYTTGLTTLGLWDGVVREGLSEALAPVVDGLGFHAAHLGLYDDLTCAWVEYLGEKVSA